MMINLSHVEYTKYICSAISKRTIRKQHLKDLYFIGRVFPEDLPEDPCIRCGWFFLSTDWVYKLAGREDPFTPACELHDNFYDVDLRPSGMTRKEADYLFLSAMLTIVEQGKGSKWVAYTYYGLARSLGYFYW